MCRQIAIGLLLVGNCGLVAAAQSRSEADGRKVIAAALVVNGHDEGTIVMVVNADRILLEAEALESAGLTIGAVPRITLDGRTFVSAAALAPAVSFRFDDMEVALRVTAVPEAFAGRTRLNDLGRADAPAHLDDRSLFVNYATQITSGRAPRYSSEIGWRTSGALLRTTLAATETGVVRGQTTWTLDDRTRMTRWEVGDTLAASSWTGTAVSVAGVTVSREFSIEPTFRPQAPLTVTGATAVPATAEVYVNNQLVARASVAPGAFELHDFVPPAGAGQVRVVLRDEFGREQEYSSNYYRSPEVLRKGLQQFRYSVGMPRVGNPDATWGYEGLAAAAEHRVGVTDWLTLGGSAAVRGSMAMGGANGSLRLPFGELESDVAASRQSNVTGLSGGLSYALRSRLLSAGASLRYTSDTFRRQVFPYSPGPSRVLGSASVDMIAGPGLTIGLRDLIQSTTVGLVEHQVGLAMSKTLWFRANLAVTVLRGANGSRPAEGLVTVTMPLGRSASASVAYSTDARGPATSANVQRSLPLGPGIGYQVQGTDRAGSSIGVAALQLKGGHGRLELRRDVGASGSVNTVIVSGAMVAVGRSLHFSAPVNDAYAVVRVPGIRGVRTYAANQYVGRTGRGGDLLVPTLVSYSANHLSIDDRDVPFMFDVRRTEAVVAPALRGGGIVVFPVESLAAEMAEAADAKTPPPAAAPDAASIGRSDESAAARIAHSMSNLLRTEIHRVTKGLR